MNQVLRAPLSRNVTKLAHNHKGVISEHQYGWSHRVANMIVTNAKLTLQLETSQAYIQKLNEDSVQLKLKLKPAWQGQRPSKTMNNTIVGCMGVKCITSTHAQVARIRRKATRKR
jgi:hypothetical protein